MRRIRTDPQGTKVAIQCDVRKCYQNIDIDVLIAMLERDIHKNKPLLWLTRKLLLIMKEKDKGLFVGSVISKDLANYYMSYLYHYAESELTVTRRSRRNGLIKVRLLSHQAMYMDDVFLSGSNRKYLMMAFRKIQQCLERKLHLEFKESGGSIMSSTRTIWSEPRLPGGFGRIRVQEKLHSVEGSYFSKRQESF